MEIILSARFMMFPGSGKPPSLAFAERAGRHAEMSPKHARKRIFMKKRIAVGSHAPMRVGPQMADSNQIKSFKIHGQFLTNKRQSLPLDVPEASVSIFT